MIVVADTGYWNALFELPLLERLGAARQEVVEYVALVNRASGFPQQPDPAQVAPDFLDDVRDAIAEMPAAVRELLSDVLLGVCFTRQLGSSAITDIVAGEHGQLLGVIVALDCDAFEHRNANAWATWKENTPFNAAAGWTLRARIEHPASDNRKNAIQYLLLHEFGHVLTAGRGFIPDWWVDPRSIAGSAHYSYLPLAWRIDPEQGIVPLPENDFPLRGEVVYYHGARLDGSAMQQVYLQLEHSGFATLYACVNVYEDFAESFATYVHTILMGKPAVIEIRRDGVLLLRTEPYWETPRSAKKYAFLHRLLGGGPSSD